MAREVGGDVSRYTVPVDGSIRDVVDNLNDSTLRVAFVVEGGRVVGSISDGDIRRALLAGHELSSPLSEVMNTSFIAVHPNTSPSALGQLFQRGIDVLPVLDERGQLLDISRRGSHWTVIPVAEPEITAYERELVLEAVDSGWVSSVGRFVSQFEEEFATFTGARTAISVNNGTSALALALWTLGIEQGDEVLVPDLTFGATANAVVQVGAKPVLVDVDSNSWSLTPATMRDAVTTRTRAIVVVHLYGIPAPMREILDFADAHGLLVIEDCAEAIGTRYKGTHVGTECDAGAFSFFGNKTITTGEGGMVTFRSAELALKARTMRAHGMSGERRYWHDHWGTNLRLTNLQAALGVAQLRRIESILNRKRYIACRYTELLESLEELGLELPLKRDDGATVSLWLYTVLLPEGLDPDFVGDEMLRSGIETRRIFYPLHSQPAFEKYKHESARYGVSERIAKRGLCLPSSVTLSDEDIVFIVDTLSELIVGGSYGGRG